jgi:hypothetical protein
MFSFYKLKFLFIIYGCPLNSTKELTLNSFQCPIEISFYMGTLCIYTYIFSGNTGLDYSAFKSCEVTYSYETFKTYPGI